MGVQRFEDLIVWQHARQYCAEIGRLTSRPNFFRQRVLQERMDKTAMSIVENIAEGFERESRREFAQFLKVARGSTAEARTQLYLAKDRNLLQEGEFDQLFEMVTGIGKMLRRLRVTILRSETAPGRVQTA
ncbi:MAG: four helix bundle protein [Vicinamibacterales bacterium]